MLNFGFYSGFFGIQLSYVPKNEIFSEKLGDKAVNCLTVGIEKTNKVGIFLIRIKMSHKSLKTCQIFLLEN